MNNTIIRKTILFRDMSEDEIHTCLNALKSQEKTYKKDSVILHAGEETDKMGLVLDGSVTIESNDVWGNCTILTHVPIGQFFAETYALLPGEVMLVDAKANEDCKILFITIGSFFKDFFFVMERKADKESSDDLSVQKSDPFRQKLSYFS